MRAIAPRSCGAAVAAKAAQQIAGEAFGMDAHQRRSADLRPADHDGQVLDRRSLGAEGDHPRVRRVLQRHARRGDLAQAGRRGDRIGDQIRRRNAEQAEPLAAAPTSRTHRRRQDGGQQPAELGQNQARPRQVGHRRRLRLRGQQRLHRGVGQAAQQLRCQQPAAEMQCDDRRSPVERAVQHGGRPHRRQQQHRRFRASAAVPPDRAARPSRPPAGSAAPRRSAARASPGADRPRRDAPPAGAAPPGRAQQPVLRRFMQRT